MVSSISLHPLSAQDETKLWKYKWSGHDTFISHGPILGRPGTDHMGVWARTSKPGEFLVLYGTEPDKLKFISPTVETDIEHDNAAWILLEGLKPNTRYYYAVVPRNEHSNPERRGEFRTLPDAADYINPDHNPKGLFNFSFQAGAGARQGPVRSSGITPYGTMLKNLKDKVYFSIDNGDWLYEEERLFPASRWIWKMGLEEADIPERVRMAPTITGAWQNYKVYLENNSNLSAWHRYVPSFHMFDDHEIQNNVYGTTIVGFQSRIALFRDIGLQAWYDYLAWSNPTDFDQEIQFGKAELKKNNDVLFDPKADFTKLDMDQTSTLHVHWGGPTAGQVDGSGRLYKEGPVDPNANIYEIVEVIDANHLRINPKPVSDTTSTYSIGKYHHFKFRVANCEFYVIDSRGQRDEATNDFKRIPGQTLLGEKQKKWLKKSMSESDADFFFLISTVNFTIPHKGNNAELRVPTEEAWPGYMAEREELIDFRESLGKPVLIITGDLHNAFVVKVTDLIWEFAACPINSDNQHTLRVEGNRPNTGIYDSGGRDVDIRWSTFYLDESPRNNRRFPVYTVFQVNNVFNNPKSGTENHWIEYEHPQVVVQYYNGFTGDLLYAEAVISR